MSYTHPYLGERRISSEDRTDMAVSDKDCAVHCTDSLLVSTDR